VRLTGRVALGVAGLSFEPRDRTADLEPAGVVAAIAPWNFPMMLELWKVAPALAGGTRSYSSLTRIPRFRRP